MITGIIMAAGFSTRFKEDKLLKSIKGITCIERVIQAALVSNLEEIVLVYTSNDVKDITRKYPINLICNHSPHLGQSVSMKLGIAMADANTTGYLFLVGDQPLITSETINQLIEEFYKEEALIVVPTYNGTRGNPVLFSSQLKEQLMAVEGDKGGRDIIKAMMEKVKLVEIADEYIGMDMDTETTYFKIIEYLNKD